MKLIPVGESNFAQVDDADFDRVNAHKWNANNNGDHLTYATATINGDVMKMERFITGDMESYCIDHRDGNSLNNTRENLRPADRFQNASNRKDKKTPKSLYGFGVRHSGGGFYAHVSLFGKRLSVGPFTDADSAQRAYDALRYLTNGEFAPLNQPEKVQDSIVALRDYMQTQRKEYIQKVVDLLGSKREAAKALGISEASIYREAL